MRAISLVDRTKRHAPGRGVLEAIAAALTIQIERDFAPAWGREPVPVTVGGRGVPIYLFDSQRAGTDYGFFSVDAQGRPYAHVYAAPSFATGAGWLDGTDSISASASHEALEMLADPSANSYCFNGARLLWGRDVCDPVQEITYTIRARGRRVPVSDFALPDYFNPYGADGPFDRQEQLGAPFTIARGGYATVESARPGRTRNRRSIDVRFDRAVPAPRRRLKRYGWGRTTWRLVLCGALRPARDDPVRLERA
jgi:hypothetical protein